jgi:hypothetical protein
LDEGGEARIGFTDFMGRESLVLGFARGAAGKPGIWFDSEHTKRMSLGIGYDEKSKDESVGLHFYNKEGGRAGSLTFNGKGEGRLSLNPGAEQPSVNLLATSKATGLYLFGPGNQPKASLSLNEEGSALSMRAEGNSASLGKFDNAAEVSVGRLGSKAALSSKVKEVESTASLAVIVGPMLSLRFKNGRIEDTARLSAAVGPHLELLSPSTGAKSSLTAAFGESALEVTQAKAVGRLGVAKGAPSLSLADAKGKRLALLPTRK